MSIIDSLVAVTKSIWPTTQKIGTVAGATITVGELETAASSLTGYLQGMRAAIAANNLALEAELTVDEALQIAKDAGIGGPGVAIAAAVLPVLFDAINAGEIPLGSLSDNAGEQQSEIVAERFGR